MRVREGRQGVSPTIQKGESKEHSEEDAGGESMRGDKLGAAHVDALVKSKMKIPQGGDE